MIAPVSSLPGTNLKRRLCCYTRSASALTREDMFGVMFAGQVSLKPRVIYENIARVLENHANHCNVRRF
jgi:hypothetical protein